ncbi:NapC/NirT family cytochrome c [Thalassotalea psychrophila]|uniref:NapC/NirT family cytochrome c n=1 Tax=Thalassotalea psychrophila TaxID=3065647 RepID=A0ABY9TSU6_9GAMM|nr:NapC/NirT family cytochrome c [Colwelliaceae bacterium SQ149]
MLDFMEWIFELLEPFGLVIVIFAIVVVLLIIAFIVSRFFNKGAVYTSFFLITVGIFVGVGSVIGFEVGMGLTNTEEFCTGCHLQPGATAETYHKSTHFKNKTGVRPVCSSCHVPVEFGNKMWRKIIASRELWSYFSGELDTTEQYLSKVVHMRDKEIARLKANDSQECRNCHEVSQMVFELQTAKAQEFHAVMKSEGKTCIDCHQGLTHLSEDVAAIVEADTH